MFNLSFFNLSVTELVVLTVFGLSLFIQLFYYFIFYIRVSVKRKAKMESVEKLPPVSIVICAKNEADNLQKNLPLILEQRYPDYEVIVVNDCSEDNTEAILNDFKNFYPHLKTTTIKKDEKFQHFKKLALTIGIKAASNEWLLLTDADCRPTTKKWLLTMATKFTNNKIVLGYSRYKKTKGFINSIIRAETALNGIQYLSFALAGNPYKGVGRNLAYRKSMFFENKGFARHIKLISGDDDLFINQVATKTNTEVEYDYTAQTISEPKGTFSSWFYQKRRHMTTRKHYSKRSKFLIDTEIISRTLLFASFATLMFISNIYTYVILAFGVYFLSQIIITKTILNRLKERQIFLTCIVYNLIAPFILLAIRLKNISKPISNKWK